MNSMIAIGIALIFIGFILVAAGIFFSTGGSAGEVHGGGIIMIGPIPVVFGTDRESATLLIVLAIILIVVSVIALFLARRIL
jgi:uncharacterized protein (TIGR00304 family)